MRMLTRVSPVADLTDLHRRLNRLFGDMWGDGLVSPGSTASFIPRLDAFETPEALFVKVEIAGVDPSTVDLSVEGGELVVAGEKARDDLPDSSKWFHGERVAGSFRRTLALPVAVDTESVSAEARNGLLTIRLPKRAEVLPKRIEVKFE